MEHISDAELEALAAVAASELDPERVTFKSTGTTGTVIATAERAGLGDLNGRWYQVRWDDGETMWVFSGSVQTDAQAAAERASNERAQVAEVFGLTGGELEEAAWVPMYVTDFNGAFDARRPFTFTYWYQGVPEYVEREFDALPLSYAPTYRTVCRNEMFGMVPERVTDDEGTWKVVKRYSTSGEVACPGQQCDPRGNDSDGVNREAIPCPYCEAAPGESHGYIYIGDGWAEIVYRLQEHDDD